MRQLMHKQKQKVQIKIVIGIVGMESTEQYGNLQICVYVALVLRYLKF